MYYTVYRITNLIDKKIYVGVHKTDNLEDEYMGSGKLLKRAQAKHGIENFRKDLIAVFDNPDEMFSLEAEIVNEEFISDDKTYNIKKGGEGGWSSDHGNSRHGTKAFSERIKSDPEFRMRFSEAVKRGAVNRKKAVRSTHSFMGRKHSEETREKMRNSHQKRRKQLSSGVTA